MVGAGIHSIGVAIMGSHNEKVSKTEAKYSRGMVHSHCGKSFTDDKSYCEHYRGPEAPSIGTCEIVAGPINPIMWCEYFKKIGK